MHAGGCRRHDRLGHCRRTDRSPAAGASARITEMMRGPRRGASSRLPLAVRAVPRRSSRRTASPSSGWWSSGGEVHKCRSTSGQRSARSAKSGGLGHWSAPAPAGRPALDRQVKLLPVSSGRGELPEIATPRGEPTTTSSPCHDGGSQGPQLAWLLRIAAHCAKGGSLSRVHGEGFSLRGGPNFLVLVVHRVVPAKLATGKSDGFVLIGKRSHRLAARAHDPSCSRQ